MQGFFKFGGYEVFKDLYINLMGEETAKHWKNPSTWLLPPSPPLPRA